MYRRTFLDSVEEIQAAVAELIAVGARNFLWSWRNPLLLQWRRGIRGLEYSTLAVMIGEIARMPPLSGCFRTLPAGRRLTGSIDPSRLEEELREIREQLIPFCEKAKRLLIRERFAMMTAPLSPVECADAEISRLRQELFASAMSHGGRFKRLIDRGGPSSLPADQEGMIAFEALLDDPGAPPLALRLGDEVKTERLVEVAGRVEAGEGPEKDPAVGLPVAEGDRLASSGGGPSRCP